MNDKKQKVLDLYAQTKSYAVVGKMMGISRQRVHQLVTGYNSSGFATSQRGNLYDKIYLSEEKNRVCMVCFSQPFEHFHHKDGNTKNNNIKNLLPVCRSCHASFREKSSVTTDLTSIGNHDIKFDKMTNRISVSELQNNPTKYFHNCHNEPIEVIKYGETLGYLVPPQSVQQKISINTNFSSTTKEEHEEEHTQ
jgi:hypothetical protein